MSTANGWAWWAGYDTELYRFGPHATREAAIAEAKADAGAYTKREPSDIFSTCIIHVVEARQDPLRLADWADFEDTFERADDSLCNSDRVGANGEEGPWFEASAEQQADLVARLKQACDDWQAAHGLVFTCQTFSATRNKDVFVSVVVEGGAPPDVAASADEAQP